jgi:hypothetical protein
MVGEIVYLQPRPVLDPSVRQTTHVLRRWLRNGGMRRTKMAATVKPFLCATNVRTGKVKGLQGRRDRIEPRPRLNVSAAAADKPAKIQGLRDLVSGGCISALNEFLDPSATVGSGYSVVTLNLRSLSCKVIVLDHVTKLAGIGPFTQVM